MKNTPKENHTAKVIEVLPPQAYNPLIVTPTEETLNDGILKSYQIGANDLADASAVIVDLKNVNTISKLGTLNLGELAKKTHEAGAHIIIANANDGVQRALVLDKIIDPTGKGSALAQYAHNIDEASNLAVIPSPTLGGTQQLAK